MRKGVQCSLLVQKVEANGIVEGETEGLMDLLPALATIEELLLEDIVTNGEQRAACGVGGSVLAVRASNTLDNGS